MSIESTQTSPPSSSSPPSLLWWQSLAASLPGTVTASLAILVVGKPLGQALPGLILRALQTPKEWAPWLAVLADLIALGLLVAPVPTLALVRSLLSRVPLLKGKE